VETLSIDSVLPDPSLTTQPFSGQEQGVDLIRSRWWASWMLLDDGFNLIVDALSQ